MTLSKEDKVKLQSYLETKAGRPDRTVGELRELLKNCARNKVGGFSQEDFVRYLEWIYEEASKKIRVKRNLRKQTF